MEGGDARIALVPGHALNKYGCPPQPDPGLMGFGSATASVISAAGFAAADDLRRRLLRAADAEPHAIIYARELNRLRQELAQLCGAGDLPGLEIVFAASGTDLHLIAAQLAGSSASVSTLALMVNAEETGSGVPAALAGRHFSAHTAYGDSVSAGSSITGTGAIEVVAVPIRLADGTPRPPAAVDAAVESLATSAVAQGRRVLLILTDVSKTGLLAPSLACIAALQRRWPDTLDILVDACQFRLAPSTLRTYLAHGFMIALTGSKFLTGPTFSGALLIPSAAAQRLRRHPLPRALQAYSATADWPDGWTTAGILDNLTNFGLLLRWEAAMAELRAFRAVPEAVVARFLQAFARAVQHRLKSDPAFELVPVPRIDRRPLIEAASWDHIPTIFPFLLHHCATRAGNRPLNQEETAQVYRRLQADLTDHPGLNPTGASHTIAAFRYQLGQPAAFGQRNGLPVSALRLCASARLVVEATTGDRDNSAVVIERALAALDKTALLVRCLPA
ncbi:hypothetical protein TPL01_04400 [Sulfuriferula plumbiphila]|uniref:Aminotransferase class V domain-containing protein n=1 Tax=Sulfuriferula plumbiphila TaxID=171865 RepID=A0A512L4B5_9PROT|nr:hypothetical protein SFPGR_12910 [Sulfuriferula plumbiphila]GEP29302.1 hypothetical protein TPL01_04400 [Sulfuriferula plumbiphila]